VRLLHVRALPTGDGSDMEMLDTMHVDLYTGQALALVRGDEIIDIDRMNGLLTTLLATPVAQGLPISREPDQNVVNHHSHLSLSMWGACDLPGRPTPKSLPSGS
jgi:hypothetical protein